MTVIFQVNASSNNLVAEVNDIYKRRFCNEMCPEDEEFCDHVVIGDDNTNNEIKSDNCVIRW